MSKSVEESNRADRVLASVSAHIIKRGIDRAYAAAADAVAMFPGIYAEVSPPTPVDIWDHAEDPLELQGFFLVIVDHENPYDNIEQVYFEITMTTSKMLAAITGAIRSTTTATLRS
jgi:hypothetical protein